MTLREQVARNKPPVTGEHFARDTHLRASGMLLAEAGRTRDLALSERQVP